MPARYLTRWSSDRFKARRDISNDDFRRNLLVEENRSTFWRGYGQGYLVAPCRLRVVIIRGFFSHSGVSRRGFWTCVASEKFCKSAYWKIDNFMFQWTDE